MPEWLSNILQYIFDFSNVMNISIAASWMILAVLILRFILKKAPKWIHVALWGMVALRLLMPFSIESEFSLIPSTETISDELLRAEPIDGQQSAYLEIVTNPVYGSGVSVELDQNISSFQWDIMSMFIPWIIGMALMAMYTSISYWRLSRKVDTAVLYQDNIFQSENIGSPFVLGIIRPRIYLPFNIEGKNLEHVVAHEQAHIRRKDHWWKPLGFLLLTIHWFNPLMWLAYVLLCRDIELACDEKVIKELDNNQRADYTQALVACSVGHHVLAACPIAFGEVGVKERVKSVMNYRKPSFWGIVIAVVVCVVTAVCFLTNPLQREESDGSDLMEVFNNLKKGWGDETVIVTDYVYADDGAYGLDGIVQYGDETRSPWNLVFIRDGIAHPISQDWGTDYIMASKLSYIGNGTVSAYVENTIDGTIYECTMMLSYDEKEGGTNFVSTSTEIKDELAEYQTDYIGDAPSVVAIAQRLPYPGGYTYSSVELQTTTEPYELMIYLDGSVNVSSEDFKYCADIAFDLIGNMSVITFIDTSTQNILASYDSNGMIDAAKESL